MSIFFSGAEHAGRPTPPPKVSVASDGTVGAADALAGMRQALRVRHYSYRTEQTYLDW